VQAAPPAAAGAEARKHVRNAAPYDSSADVYSYGILLWEIMHEQIPFAGLLGVQACFNAAELAARPPIRLPPDRVPFADIITSCWEHTPSKRVTMPEVLRLLRPLHSGGEDETSLLAQ